ncbi:MAG: magnesium chelatase, partial [Dehalococcoidia bacterium]|nr:magnesium chelatase [Dehalococcoidia bacterium]
ITTQARLSSEINQRSGVSVRVSIANFETMLGNAVRRSIRNGEEWACPRVSDLSYIVASFAGKIELETFEEGRESRLTDDLTRRAVLRIFGSYFDVDELDPVVTAFDLGNQAETGSDLSAAGYPDLVKNIDGLAKAIKKLTDDKRPEVIAAAVEFILEGLHLSRKLNCDRSGEAAVYKR